MRTARAWLRWSLLFVLNVSACSNADGALDTAAPSDEGIADTEVSNDALDEVAATEAAVEVGVADAAPDAVVDAGSVADADAEAPVDAVGDTAVLDTYVPPDVGPPTVTFRFVVAPGDAGKVDIASAWSGLNARMQPLEQVYGYRMLPGSKTKWASWSAVLNFDGTALTCKPAKVRVFVLWQAINPTTLVPTDYQSSAEVLAENTVASYTTGNTIAAPGPEPASGASYSEVKLMIARIGDGCGTLWARPSSFTFVASP